MTTGSLPPEVPPVPPELFEGDEPTPFETPGGTAALFLLGLGDPAKYQVALHNLTTPESHEAWGDFTEIAAEVGSFSWSFGTIGERPAPDVAYIAVLEDTTDEVHYVLEDTEVEARAVLTLVDRPSAGGWLVHAYGTRLEPNELPRESHAD